MLASFAGGRFFGARFGGDPPVAVALPGWQHAHGDFEAAAGILAGTLAAAGCPGGLVAVDPPGFGATPPPGEPWSTAQYAEALVPVVEELGAPLVLVGHSFGGRIAAQLAASRPDLVRGLVLASVPLVKGYVVGQPAGQLASGRPRKSPAGYRLVRALRRAHVVPEARLEAARRKYGSADYAAATGVMRDVLVKAVNESYDDAIARIAAAGFPVELVWGENDSEVPPGVAEEIARRVPRACLTLCPGAGHLVPTTAPDALAGAIARVTG